MRKQPHSMMGHYNNSRNLKGNGDPLLDESSFNNYMNPLKIVPINKSKSIDPDNRPKQSLRGK